MTDVKMIDPERQALFERYLLDIPNIHSWDGGKTWGPGGFTPWHLRGIYDIFQSFPSPPRVLETGAGNSSICFLLAGAAELVSIAPDAALFERIQAFCATLGIDTSPLRPIVAFSEHALPPLAAEATQEDRTIDFALLDGGHGWPTVFVDFCYTYAMLRRGGLIMIDDIQLHSVKELARFMTKGRQFEFVADLGKSLIFRKKHAERHIGDFGGQAYILERTKADADAGRPFVLF